MMCLCDAGEAGPEEPSLGSRQLGIRAQHSRVTGSRVEIAPDWKCYFVRQIQPRQKQIVTYGKNYCTTCLDLAKLKLNRFTSRWVTWKLPLPKDVIVHWKQLDFTPIDYNSVTLWRQTNTVRPWNPLVYGHEQQYWPKLRAILCL